MTIAPSAARRRSWQTEPNDSRPATPDAPTDALSHQLAKEPIPS